MIVADTSFIYALLDSADRRHEEAASWYATVEDDMATTPLVVAEVDHLAHRAGAKAQKAFRRDLADGAYELEWSSAMIGPIVVIAETYRDLGVSLADASLVQLASHFGTERIATFDERDFRAMKPLEGPAAFTLLPADA